MVIYQISGVWKDSTGKVTHYAVHHVINGLFHDAQKTSKATTITLVKNPSNTVWTMTWNYQSCTWEPGDLVETAGHGLAEYIKTKGNNRLKDNLQHLIDYTGVFG